MDFASYTQPSVTVIVPMYMVENYIEKCATTLFEQTLTNMEFLFVDDCSPDNGIEVLKATLKRYPQRKEQTRIIRLSANCGVAAVRRIGILDAQGEYVIHCDGDDWVDIDLYERMYAKAVVENADIVICDEIHEKEGNSYLHEEPPLPMKCRDVVRDWYRSIMPMFFHNKLVRRSLYTDHDVLPPAGLDMWEDNGLMTRLFYYGGRLAQIHGSCYHYNRNNSNAMTSGYGLKQVNQMIGVANHLTDFFESKPDRELYEKTKMAFQFLARINLVTDSFENLKRYNHTFMGSEAIVPELDPRAFSSKGLFRFRMVQMRLGWLFVILYKLKNLIGGAYWNGIDLKHYDRTSEVMAQAATIRKDNVLTFINVGTLIGDRGINELIEAFVRLHKERPDTRLLLVGWSEEELDQLREDTLQHIATCGAIDVAGQVDDVRPWLAASDVAVFSSYREDQPEVVLQAGAMGLPQIVTDVNGSRQLIVDGKNGLVVPPRNMEALYVAMRKMSESEVYRSALAEEARKLVANRKDTSVVRSCLYKHYEDIL